MSLPELDTLAFLFVNTYLANSLFDHFMPFVTDRSYFFFLPLFLWLFFKDREKTFVALALGIIALLLSDWAANELKHVFERLRPCNEIRDVRMLAGCGKSFSLPSNHAVNAFAFITPFFILLKKSWTRYAFAALAVLVGFSRVYVGVHYPADVLAGALLGIFLGFCTLQVYNRSSQRYRGKPYTTMLFLFLLGISLFRIYYIQHGPLDLSPDEAHYWEWSRRLDLSYYSKGPMIAYLIYLGTALFGDTVFGIRIMAVLFSVLSSMLMYSLGKKMYDEKAGFFSALVIQIVPLFSAYGILFTIDSPFIFFWIASLFLFREAIQSHGLSVSDKDSNPPLPPFSFDSSNPPECGKRGHGGITVPPMLYWLFLGLFIGLGLLTKYTMAFFPVCAFLFLVVSAEKRRLLLTAGPYIAFFTSLAVFSPVILWNSQHGWVTLKHTAGQAHLSQGIQFSLNSLAEFVGSQLGVITPLLLILMVVSVIRLRKEREGYLLFWFSVPVFAFFLFKSMHAKVQANWALPGYIGGIVSFCALYPGRFRELGKGKKILVSAALVFSLMITSFAHYSSLLNLPVELDPASRVRGWRVLGEAVTKIYNEMSLSGPVFIFSDRYQVSSQLAFYVKGHPVTYCINLDRRMNQYDLWPGFHNLSGYNAIFVRTGDKKVPPEVAAAFAKVEKKVYTAYTKQHVGLRDYSVFLCYAFKGLPQVKPEAF
jgi:undecaprenyl-diphosphatase